MALNRERPHLLVLPEDDATRSVAVGFNDRVVGQMQVLRPARGWAHVLEAFTETHLDKLRRYPGCHLVLLIDFDNDFRARLGAFQQSIPADLAGRVYVLGALTDAEAAKRSTGKKLGALGDSLARECEANQLTLWNDAQLRHNDGEVQRLTANVRPFLF